MKWPFNTTTLKTHLHARYFNTIIRLQNQALESDDPIEESILGSSLTMGAESSAHTLDKSMSVSGSSSSANASMVVSNRSLPSYSYFQIGEYKSRVLKFIIANSLPFAFLDSPTFEGVVRYLKEDLPGSVTRKTIKKDLHSLFWCEMKRLREKISKNSGRFALTMDEWNSSNNYDFLAVTLHFYNDDFQLDSYNIGFENLNESTSYTGETLFEFLKQILGDYGLTHRIMSITRDNAGPMNTCMRIFAGNLNKEGIDFTGDVRCAEHIFNLAIKEILRHTFFRSNRTRRFEVSLNEIAQSNPGHEDLLLSMKTLPGTVRSIISGIRHNHFLKNTFSKKVQNKRAAKNTFLGPEVLVRDNETRWLSTFKMMNDRFLYFKEEIKDLLRLSSVRNGNEDVDLESCEISESEWEYLATLRDGL